jgi:2-dehydropantoate 2-reductase
MIRTQGLRFESVDGSDVLRLPIADDPADVDLTDAVVLLAVKSQDSARALSDLARAAVADVPIVCLQNGVENERLALRFFAAVYGACVLCPSEHLEPGVVTAYSWPVTGIVDVGRFPRGVDDTATAVAAALAESTFESRPVADVMRQKYGKLLVNLGNAVEVVCGLSARWGPVGQRALDEGTAVLAAAGIDHEPVIDGAERVKELLRFHPVGDNVRVGSSMWQSAQRGAGSVEVDFLNGEIVLLGRLLGVPTPVNELLCQEANEIARSRRAPGQLTEDKFLDRVRATA